MFYRTAPFHRPSTTLTQFSRSRYTLTVNMS